MSRDAKPNRLIIRPLFVFKERSFQQSIRNAIKKQLERLLEIQGDKELREELLKLTAKKVQKRSQRCAGKRTHKHVPLAYPCSGSTELVAQYEAFGHALSSYTSLRKQLESFHKKRNHTSQQQQQIDTTIIPVPTKPPPTITTLPPDNLQVMSIGSFHGAQVGNIDTMLLNFQHQSSYSDPHWTICPLTERTPPVL